MMRFRVSVLVFLLVVLAAATTDAQALTGGAMVGLGFTSLPHAGEVLDQAVKDTSTESSSRMGTVLGGFIRMPIADQWSLQPELHFVVKGVTLAESASGGSLTASIRYLEFPVLARYQTSVAAHAAHVMAGPVFGVKAGTSAHLDAPNQSVDANIDSSIRTLDVGLAFVAGLDFGRYFVDARYTRGLRDVGGDGVPHADALHNRSLAFVLGIQFR